MKDRITKKEAAELLGCCTRTVNRLVTRKLLTPRRRGHRTVDFDRNVVLKLKPILQSDKRQLILRVIAGKGGAR